MENFIRDMKYSIILTIHNKDFLVGQSLHRLKKFTGGDYEIVIILDGCNDDSEDIVKSFISLNADMVIKLLYADDVFEVISNNIGFKASRNDSDYLIILQDDQLVNELDWNIRLTTPFRVFDDVFAVSANCAHNWIENPTSVHINLEENLDDCWSDIVKHVDHAGKAWNQPRNIFAVRESVNRGPLAIKHSDLIEMDYLDEEFAPLDMDDHDLCMRMHKKLGKVVGCYWVDFISEFAWGGTHDEGGHKPWFYESNHKNTKIFWERHSDYVKDNRKIENRIIE